MNLVTVLSRYLPKQGRFNLDDGGSKHGIYRGICLLFQERDLDLLGMQAETALQKALRSVDLYWMTFEIAGVSLLI